MVTNRAGMTLPSLLGRLSYLVGKESDSLNGAPPAN